MEVMFNGVGDAFSTKHWGTSFVLRDPTGFTLAIDCPDSYRRALETNGFTTESGTLTVDDLDALYLTHLHGDHVNGLEMTLAYRMFVSKKPLKVYTTPEAAQLLWSHRLAPSLGAIWDGTQHLKTDFGTFGELHEIEWGAPTEIGPFTLTTRKTVHHIPTSAIRITDSAGAILSYSCDTAFDPELISWLSDCDLLIHESAHGPAHTPLSALEGLSAELREKMVVVHYPDELHQNHTILRLGVEGETFVI